MRKINKQKGSKRYLQKETKRSWKINKKQYRL